MSRTKKGIVTSTKGNKTAVVSVSTRKTHPKYKKQYTVTSKYHAHDEDNSCQEGQEITITECKPVSKLKKWVVLK